MNPETQTLNAQFAQPGRIAFATGEGELPYASLTHPRGDRAEVYLHGGLRAIEIGSVMFGKTDPDTGKMIPAPLELVRLAIPRRVYTQSHIDYSAEVINEVYAKRHELKGVEMTYAAPFLRHFTARFEPLA